MIYDVMQDITLEEFFNEIERDIKSKCFLSALSLTLMIPDICSKLENKRNSKAYIEWFNKWVYEKFYSFPTEEDIKQFNSPNSDLHRIKFNGMVCYKLRCAILHNGNLKLDIPKKEKDRKELKITDIELCVNSKSPKEYQYGEATSIIGETPYNKGQVNLRINIITLSSNMIAGCKDFLKATGNENKKLFELIDWDQYSVPIDMSIFK